MCGRVVQVASGEELAALFGLEEAPEAAPRYNLPPGELLTVIHAAGARRLGVRAHWGLRREKDGRFLFLLRSETTKLDTGPFRGEPCLVPVSGFFEWQPRGKVKQPYLFRRDDRQVFPIAGIWQPSRKGEDPLGTCVVLTRPADDVVRPVHERMPVVLDPETVGPWLEGVPLASLDLSRPRLSATPVSTRMNRTSVDDPGCLDPAAPAEPPQRTLF
jgi:putative SOS response-associated peptidase YedK